MEQLVVNAEFVEAVEQEFVSDYTVVGIYFGEGDPDNGGKHWNFTRGICDDEDDGVCTVKEIQQAVVYGGITNFSMSRDGLVCKFDEYASQKTGVNELEIHYNVTQSKWSELCAMAEGVPGCGLFSN